MMNRSRWRGNRHIGRVIVRIKLTNLKDKFLKAAGARRTKPGASKSIRWWIRERPGFYLKSSVIKKLG